MILALRNRCSDTVFLALGVWRESRGEPRETQEAVAMSVLNRVNRPAWWGTDPMSVLFKKWQVSSLTDPKDRQLVVWPTAALQSWQLALEVADNALSGKIQHPATGADSWFDESIPRPYWATDQTFVRKIGRMEFHNVDKDVEVTP